MTRSGRSHHADRGSQVLAGYLVPGEDLVIVHRQHWAVLAEPVASSVAGLVLLVVLTARADGVPGPLGCVLWLGWLVLLARLGWHVVQWSTSWFGATNRRMMLRSGVVTHKLAMMPLEKVTDMTYERSWAGHLLGYGRFVLESAGQDQALRTVPWVPDPDESYRRLCSMIFAPQKAGAPASTPAWKAPQRRSSGGRWQDDLGDAPWSTTGADEVDESRSSSSDRTVPYQPTVQVPHALPPAYPPGPDRPPRPPD